MRFRKTLGVLAFALVGGVLTYAPAAQAAGTPGDHVLGHRCRTYATKVTNENNETTRRSSRTRRPARRVALNGTTSYTGSAGVARRPGSATARTAWGRRTGQHGVSAVGVSGLSTNGTESGKGAARSTARARARGHGRRTEHRRVRHRRSGCGVGPTGVQGTEPARRGWACTGTRRARHRSASTEAGRPGWGRSLSSRAWRRDANTGELRPLRETLTWRLGRRF
jgi:hypothetical protein